MKRQINWIIHCCTNGVCDECGNVEMSFLPYTCNAHTHGMEQYGHMDFQMVLRVSNTEIMRILNTLGLRVQSGEKFKAGDYVSGIYEDCDVRLDEFWETDRSVLRVIIPDKNNIYPEDESCAIPYRFQKLLTDSLFKQDGGTMP